MSDMHFLSFGSQQQRLLRRGIRDGLSVEDAAARANCDIDTARLIAADDLKNPPPPGAYELLYDPDAPAAASSTQAKEATMAKADDDSAGEYKRPDAAKAFEIYDKQIKPKEAHLATIKGDMAEPYQQIKDQAHFPRKVLNFIIGLENEEDAKRDHLLLALSEGLKLRKIFLPRDLVTIAQGENGHDVIPTGEAEDDGLLVDQADDEAGEEFTEAPEEELAAQEGRGRKRKPRTATISQINPLNSPPEIRAH